jgi:hypothetical protein
MFEGLYLLYYEKESIWQLRLKDSFYCLSACSNLDTMKRYIKNLVKKYRSEFKLTNALSNTQDGGRLSEAEYERQVTLYNELGHKYKDLIHEEVVEAFNEVKMDTPVIKNTKKFKKVNLFPTTSKVIMTKEELPKEEATVKLSIPKNRTPLLGIKKLNIISI